MREKTEFRYEESMGTNGIDSTYQTRIVLKGASFNDRGSRFLIKS